MKIYDQQRLESLYHRWRAWYNGSYTIMAKPIKTLELHYQMIQFLILKFSLCVLRVVYVL